MQMDGNFIKPFLPENLKASLDIWLNCGHRQAHVGTCEHMWPRAGMRSCIPVMCMKAHAGMYTHMHAHRWESHKSRDQSSVTVKAWFYIQV